MLCLSSFELYSHWVPLVHGLRVSVLSTTTQTTIHLWEVQISKQQEAGIVNSYGDNSVVLCFQGTISLDDGFGNEF